MSGYEWLLFIHVLAAFAVVTGLALVTPLALGATVAEPASSALVKLSRILFGAGGLGTLVFGVWLVAERDYRFFKLWVIGALALWLVAAASGNQVEGAKDRGLYAAAVISTLLILVLMIFKPGV